MFQDSLYTKLCFGLVASSFNMSQLFREAALKRLDLCIATPGDKFEDLKKDILQDAAAMSRCLGCFLDCLRCRTTPSMLWQVNVLSVLNFCLMISWDSGNQSHVFGPVILSQFSLSGPQSRFRRTH